MSEYKPKVGEECEVFHPLNENWYQVKITAETELSYVVTQTNRQEEYLLQKSLNKFRPIQSEAEIEKERKREEQIFKIKELLFDIEADNPTINAEDFYDSGVRVIAEDEYVVNRLSDKFYKQLSMWHRQ